MQILKSGVSVCASLVKGSYLTRAKLVSIFTLQTSGMWSRVLWLTGYNVLSCVIPIVLSQNTMYNIMCIFI